MSLSSRVPVGRSLAASRRPAPRASVRCVADAATAVSTETLKRKILRLSALTDRGQVSFLHGYGYSYGYGCGYGYGYGCGSGYGYCYSYV